MKLRVVIVSFLIIVFLSSCSEYNKLMKSTDYDAKYDAAIAYFEDESYYKSFTLIEDILPYFRGRQQAEELLYYYAYCEYNLQDYVMAAYRFKNFTKTFPRSKHAEECIFMSAYCFYVNSPPFSLDQTNTYRAIDELQLFANAFPSSNLLDSCNVLIDELRGKLEKKAFENSYQYFKTRDYKSSSLSFKTLLNDFPDTDFRERAMFLILKSDYLLAENSIDSKKTERLEKAIKSYKIFVDEFPQSEYLRDAESYFDKANFALSKANANIDIQ